MAEIATMVPVMERFTQAGLTIIMIEHRLRELFRLANRVIVLNFGRKIADGAPADAMEMEEVKAAYMGTEVVSLEAKNIMLFYENAIAVNNFSFTAEAGKITGTFGLTAQANRV